MSINIYSELPSDILPYNPVSYKKLLKFIAGNSAVYVYIGGYPVPNLSQRSCFIIVTGMQQCVVLTEIGVHRAIVKCPRILIPQIFVYIFKKEV